MLRFVDKSVTGKTAEHLVRLWSSIIMLVMQVNNNTPEIGNGQGNDF